MGKERMTDERLEEIRQAVDELDVFVFDLGEAAQIVKALVVARAEVAMLNDVRDQMADEIARLNGLLDWAYDGLDVHWVTLPENAKRMKQIATLFGRKYA